MTTALTYLKNKPLTLFIIEHVKVLCTSFQSSPLNYDYLLLSVSIPTPAAHLPPWIPSKLQTHYLACACVECVMPKFMFVSYSWLPPKSKVVPRVPTKISKVKKKKKYNKIKTRPIWKEKTHFLIHSILLLLLPRLPHTPLSHGEREREDGLACADKG